MDNQQERERARIRYLLDHCAANDTVSVSESVPNYREIHTYATKWLRNSLDREEQLIAEIYRLGKECNAYKISKDAYKESYEKYSEALKGAKTTNLELARKVAEQDKEIQRYKQALEYAVGQTKYIATIHEREWRMDDPIELARQLNEEIAEVLSPTEENQS